MQRTRRRNIPCAVGWLAVVGAKMCATWSVGAAFSQVVFLGGGKMHTFRVGGHLTVYFPRSPRKGGRPTRYLCTPTSSGSPITPPAKNSVLPKRLRGVVNHSYGAPENAAGTCGNKPRCPKIARWTCVPSAHAQFKRKLLLCCRPLAQRRPPPFVGSELDRY